MYRHLCGLLRVRYESLHHHTIARLRRRRIPRKDTAGFETGESSLLVHRFSARRGKEELRFHETLVSKVADTGRGGGSRALVAWLDRHAALPRDTLLKQRTTLKFSESTGCVCKGNKSVTIRDARDRSMPRDFKLWDILGWKIF